MPRLEIDDAIDCATAVLHGLGANQRAARAVAGWLINADVSGHPSHGIIRLMDYRNRRDSGNLDPSAEPTVTPETQDGSTVLIDGGHGFGHLAAEKLVEEMVARVRERKIVAGGIVNASHTGRLGEWADLAMRSGAILLMCEASLGKGNVAAYGAREARLGTNPITIGVPGEGDDGLVLDYATSEIAGGKIQHLIATGRPAPEGSLIDSSGHPSTNPEDWLDGGALLTMGGHKGYGLSLVISLLAGCVVGQVAEDRERGVFALAIDPGLFADAREVSGSVSTQLARMRSTPSAPGFERVEVPGDFERRNRKDHGRHVDVPRSTWDDILALAGELGVETTGWAS